MAFTRTAVFLKWSSDTQKRAFQALQAEYSGGTTVKPGSFARSLYDNSLLIVRGLTKRQFTAVLVGYDSAPSGTVSDGAESISWGSITDLISAHAATDLKVKSFEDSDYWTCEWRGDWRPVLEYDPVRNYAAIPTVLEQK